MKNTNWLILGNTWMEWGLALLVAFSIVVLILLLKKIVIRYLVRLVHKTKTEVDDVITELLASTKVWLLIPLCCFLGSLALTLPHPALRWLKVFVLAGVWLQVGLWGNQIISVWLNNKLGKKSDVAGADSTNSARTLISFASRVVLWIVVLLLLLENIGVDITALVAGLGIGGIAIALAMQNILGDLFASLSIVLDKPFLIGDFVFVGDQMGVVEHIGLKTTRIRSLGGEQIILSNTDILKSRVSNYKRMQERRVLFTLGLTHQTDQEKLAEVPAMIREIVMNQQKTRFDRAHFKAFGDSALIFEVVYFVLDPDYNLYMDIQHNINLDLNKRFSQAGIKFAYPTQTLYVFRKEGTNG